MKIITHSICKLFLNLVDTILFRFIFTVNFLSSFRRLGFLPFLSLNGLNFFGNERGTGAEKSSCNCFWGLHWGRDRQLLANFIPVPRNSSKSLWKSIHLSIFALKREASVLDRALFALSFGLKLSCSDRTLPGNAYRLSQSEIRAPLKTSAWEATRKTNLDLSSLSRTCDTESSFRTMSVSLYDLV